MSIITRFTVPVVSRSLKWLCRQRLPQTIGEMHMPGISGRVEILRDRLGIPHIYAETLQDAVYAQGVVHVQDRLWQMEFTRRLVAGRLAEILGDVALPVDRWMRTLGLYRAGAQEVSLLPQREKDLLAAYAGGVNAAMQRGPLPVEFLLLGCQPEAWVPADSLAWEKLMAWNLSGNWEAELLRGEMLKRLGPERMAALGLDSAGSWPVILEAGRDNNPARPARRFSGPGPGEGAGSNHWVVSGAHSRSGKPLLANDMHLGLTAPAIWYEIHLSGGDLHATGVSLPGAPLVVAGHNGKVTWGYTAGFADVQDLYEEHVRSAAGGGLEVEFRGEWVAAETRREEIRVKGGQTVSMQVTCTPHGPLINELVEKNPPAGPLALRFSALDPEPGVFTALLSMNLARDCGEFRQALLEWSGSVLNVVYADTRGEIGYRLIGRVPVRARGDGSRPVPGWSGEYEWTGMIPPEQMPGLDNPPGGKIFSANNRVAGPEYPHFLGVDFLYSDRAERIGELLREREPLDPAWFQEMQFDQISPTARVVARAVGELDLSGLDPRTSAAARILANWDGCLSGDSPAAAVEQVFVRQVLRLLFEGKLGELTARALGEGPNPVIATESLHGFHAWEWLRARLEEGDSAWFDPGDGQNRADVLREGLRRAVDQLTEIQGPDPSGWAWGKMHLLTFHHILGRKTPLQSVFNRGPYPVGGDGTTVWASLGSHAAADANSSSGPPFRFIADLSDLDHCLGLLAPGQSGNPASPHYADQIEDWFRRGYHVMRFRRAEVEAELEARLVLFPG